MNIFEVKYRSDKFNGKELVIVDLGDSYSIYMFSSQLKRSLTYNLEKKVIDYIEKNSSGIKEILNEYIKENDFEISLKMKKDIAEYIKNSYEYLKEKEENFIDIDFLEEELSSMKIDIFDNFFIEKKVGKQIQKRFLELVKKEFIYSSKNSKENIYNFFLYIGMKDRMNDIDYIVENFSFFIDIKEKNIEEFYNEIENGLKKRNLI